MMMKRNRMKKFQKQNSGKEVSSLERERKITREKKQPREKKVIQTERERERNL